MRFSLPAAAQSIALTVALASCVAPPVQPPSPPPPPPAPVPAPQPAPAPAPLARDWQDWPVTPGAWRYEAGSQVSEVMFGPAGATPLLSIRCDLAARRVTFSRAGMAQSGPMVVRTSFGAVQWPATATAPGAVPQIVATRAAGDAALDQIAFSRGRFVIEVVGLSPLVLPTWAEVTRVVEDCRG